MNLSLWAILWFLIGADVMGLFVTSMLFFNRKVQRRWLHFLNAASREKE